MIDPYESGFIELNDASIYYEKRGKGHPVILISGFISDHNLFKPILKPLLEHFQVISFDNRGSGRTKDFAKQLSAELIADDIYHLIEKLGLKKVHIVGQSMGGTIAQKFAALYPKSVDKLVLMLTSAKWKQAAILAMKSHLALRKNSTHPSIVFDMIAPWIYGETFLSNRLKLENMKQLTLANIYQSSIEDEERQLEILTLFDAREDLKKISAETLIISAKEDLLVSREDSEYLKQHIPHARIATLDGGHGLIIENTKDLVQVLLNHLL